MNVHGYSPLIDFSHYTQKMLLGQTQTLCMEYGIPRTTRCHHQKCMYVYVFVCMCMYNLCIGVYVHECGHKCI